MARPQRHLKAVADAAPTPNGTADILPIIEAGLRQLEADDKARRITERGTDRKLNPSVSDAGKCIRKVVLSLRNVPESDPLDTDSRLRFMVGHAFEEAMGRILTAYQGATYLQEARVEITDGDTKITGRRDFDSVRVLLNDSMLELKSTNARAMGFLLKRGSPNDDHVRQINLYLHATGKPSGYLVYLAAGATKGEPNLHAWRIEYDRDMARADIASLIEADMLAKEGRIPPVPDGYTWAKFPCGWCGYRSMCHNRDTEAALRASLAAGGENATA